MHTLRPCGPSAPSSPSSTTPDPDSPAFFLPFPLLTANPNRPIALAECLCHEAFFMLLFCSSWIAMVSFCSVRPLMLFTPFLNRLIVSSDKLA